MSEPTIVCPKCGARIAISKALTHQIEKELRAAFEERAERTQRDQQLAFNKKLAEETAKLEKQLKEKAEKAAAAELSRLQKQVADAQRRAKAAQATFEERLQEERGRLGKEMQKATEDAAKKIEADHRLRELQLEKRLTIAKKQAYELKRKLEQGSQQLQGAVAQVDLGDTLTKLFPDDQIDQIRQGVLGADVSQRVYSPSGQLCGSILWESKNTTTWGRDWLAKLRGDQRRAKADIAVLVSATLPESLPHFGLVEGVWVTGFPLAACLAAALRMNLIQVAGLQQASKDNSDVKMKLLYEYLSSTEFRNRIEAIVEGFLAMQSDLNRERVAMEGYWAKREKQLRQVVDNVSGMYGDMRAIAGPALPTIGRLELPVSARS